MLVNRQKKSRLSMFKQLNKHYSTSYKTQSIVVLTFGFKRLKCWGLEHFNNL